MQPRDRIVTSGAPIDLGQVAYGATRADQTLVGQERAHAFLFHRLVHMRFQAAHLSPGGRIGAQKPVVQAQRTELQAPRALQLSVAEVNQLQAAAADIKHDAVLHRQPMHGAEKPEPRFFLAVGNLDRYPQLTARPLDQLFAVAGFAHRRGRHGHGPFGAGSPRHGQKAAHDTQGALDGLGFEQAISGHVTDEPQRTARIAQDIQVGRPVDPRDHYPTAV